MGRKKGDFNSSTKDIRDKFQQLVEGQLETLEADLKALTAKDRVKAILDLSRFVIPQLRSVEVKQDDDKSINILNLGNRVRITVQNNQGKRRTRELVLTDKRLAFFSKKIGISESGYTILWINKTD